MLLALIAPVAPTAPLAPAYAQPPTPELTRPVNDFANVINPEQEAEIERRILALKKATTSGQSQGDVVVVATIDTFAPYADIREYAVRMFENRGRGIGERGKDNGLLVLVAVKDRRVWVEVGYDLEQFVTDGFAGEVSRNDMTPYFARGDYGGGVLAGVTRLIGRIAQGRGVSVTGVPVTSPDRISDFRLSPWVILAFIILFIILSNSGGGRRSRGRGGRTHWGGDSWSGWNSGVGPFGGGGGRTGGGGFGGGFGGFGGGRSGGGGGGASW
ncbi:MAG: TPM domain-containing protein [Acidobacteria bacterium]|nr:MAG: TPM domain-containing protein [Acidobacteriota bacterium]